VWLHLGLLASQQERWKLLKRTFIPAVIGPIGSVPLQERNRRPVQPRGGHRWQQYIAYLVSRSIGHGSANLSTLVRWLGWRLPQHLFMP
jgi:hypothetical protein